MDPMPLRKLLQAWIDAEPGRSARKIAAAGGISHQNVNNILNGKHGGQIEERTIKGLATGTGISERELRKAAGLPDDLGPFALPDRAARLSRRQREAILASVEAMLGANIYESGGEGNPTGTLDVTAAIKADPRLSRRQREHLLNQYEILVEHAALASPDRIRETPAEVTKLPVRSKGQPSVLPAVARRRDPKARPPGEPHP